MTDRVSRLQLAGLVLCLATIGIASGCGSASGSGPSRGDRRSEPAAAKSPAKSVGGSAGSPFNFGYDFDTYEPDFPGTNSTADAAALTVLADTPGAIVRQNMFNFGAEINPEPRPGEYNAADFVYPDTKFDRTLGSRLTMITNAHDIPVIGVFSAPPWMFGCTTATCTSSPCDPDLFHGQGTPPCPQYYADFAALAAHVAQAFRKVKYFVVWNEFMGFTERGGTIDAANYTTMYNDVYSAIKLVRPNAIVGGPYAPMGAFPLTTTKCSPSSPCTDNCAGFTLCSPTWGVIPEQVVTAVEYWLHNNRGADFVAVDGPTEIADANYGIGDATVAASPLDASEQYAAVDTWIRRETKLPIWWLESHLQPCNAYDGSNCDPDTPCTAATCWTDTQAAASRIATLALMNSSGAAVGMQWQPQEDMGFPDEGLWTNTQDQSGGVATTLDQDLNQAAAVLRHPLTVKSGEPDGVLVAATPDHHALLVNTRPTPVVATFEGKSFTLAAGEVRIVAG